MTYHRVSEKSLNTRFLSLFISSHMHFTDPADLCEHPHSQQRAWCVTRSFASSVAFMVLERSECSNMVEHGTAISTDYFPTDLCGDFAMGAETGAHIIFQDICWMFQGESFTFHYDKVVLPMIKEFLCMEVAFLMAVGMVSSPDSPRALCVLSFCEPNAC